MHHEGSNGGDSPGAKPLDELFIWRLELRKKVLERLVELDPTEPDTLQFAVSAMLEVHFKPKDLSASLGPSQTTIGRWAMGQTIPRSAPYRKWLVETLIEHLRVDDHVERRSISSDPAASIGIAKRRPGVSANLAQ